MAHVTRFAKVVKGWRKVIRATLRRPPAWSRARSRRIMPPGQDGHQRDEGDGAAEEPGCLVGGCSTTRPKTSGPSAAPP